MQGEHGGIGDTVSQTVGAKKNQWDTLCNCDLFFGVAVSQFQVDLSVTWFEHFWVISFCSCNVRHVVISIQTWVDILRNIQVPQHQLPKVVIFIATVQWVVEMKKMENCQCHTFLDWQTNTKICFRDCLFIFEHFFFKSAFSKK